MAGSFGMAASSSKQRKWRLTTTILVSAFALGASIVSATLSGMAASMDVLPGCENSEYGKTCGPWVGLEWSLMAVSVLAAISSVVLILCASDVLCCGNYSRHNIATTTVSRQQVGTLWKSAPTTIGSLQASSTSAGVIECATATNISSILRPQDNPA
ncbi:uncharacterized protein LOC124209427 [Daphnia pulex]|uniref:uncharacterized protein LOC124209427 n=1 Tax=Daphnia pulex TaxID=6669 RepID=UPI001EE0DBDF|nr:uncharacterized protein LOC124209427 [Daphnia pulex]